MSIFCIKKLGKSTRLSDRLKARRAEKNLSLPELSALTRIPLKYLQAIETNAFSLLPPAKIFRASYIKEYAVAVGLDPKPCLDQFCREEGLEGAIQIHPHTSIKNFPFASMSIFVRNAVLICFVLLFGAYLTWQVKGILEPPKLIIYAPLEGDSSNQSTILVQGETEPESKLTINGQTAVVKENGRFEISLDAAVGVNTINITATKKHGKTTTAIRHVVIRPRPITEKVSTVEQKAVNN